MAIFDIAPLDKNRQHVACLQWKVLQVEVPLSCPPSLYSQKVLLMVVE